MGKFDYPSPYWDSVGDPALDLIDRMLTVDPEKRITIDECLQHPWITTHGLVGNQMPPPGPGDSTDGLTGAMGQLDFSKRKVARERTLLSDINDIKVSKVVSGQDEKQPVKVFEKNLEGKHVHVTQSQTAEQATAHEGQDQNAKIAKSVPMEPIPAASQQARVFMEMGGKGDQQLFDNDAGSRYEPDEVPRKALLS